MAWKNAAVGTTAPQIVVLVVLFIVGSQLLPGYGSWTGIRAMLVEGSILGIASGAALAVLLAGIDLSIPAVIGIGDAMAMWLTYVDRWPFWAGALVALVAAAFVGCVNGVVASKRSLFLRSS